MKHYIRPNQNSCVTKVFGPHIEKPQQGDVLFAETSDHIHPLANDIFDHQGYYKWAWNGAEVVQTTLDAQIEEVKRRKLVELDSLAQSSIVTTYPPSKQNNIMMEGWNKSTSSNYTVDDKAKMVQDITTIRTKLATLEGQVNAATTAAQVGGISW